MKIINKAKHLWSLIQQIRQLPKLNLNFELQPLEQNDVQLTYHYFSSPHKKYRIFKNKEIGVALIDLSRFTTGEDYLNSINGKNSAYYYARKAKNRGYTFKEIDRNHYIDDIYEVNTSSTERQGRKMAQHYLAKPTHFDNLENYRYFGVLDQEQKLRSYCCIGYYGKFAVVSQLLGHKDFLNDGIMYLMISEVVQIEISQKKLQWFMYDTFFGAKEGLKLFKNKLGFMPYRVQWSHNV